MFYRYMVCMCVTVLQPCSTVFLRIAALSLTISCVELCSQMIFSMFRLFFSLPLVQSDLNILLLLLFSLQVFYIFLFAAYISSSSFQNVCVCVCVDIYFAILCVVIESVQKQNVLYIVRPIPHQLQPAETTKMIITINKIK